jgi:hypothetical protein
VVAALLSGAAIVLTASAATAAPIDFPTGQVFQGNCGDQLVQFLPAPGDGVFTPYFITGTSDVLVPYQVKFNAYSGGGTLKTRHQGTLGTTLTKPGPAPDDLVSCEIYGSFGTPSDSVSFTGTIVGVIRGQP